MFERRLKVVLGALALVTLLLILRAGQVQVVQNDEWTQKAAETMKRSQLLDTVRGTIRDRKDRVIASDTACVDVCVDYRAMTDPPEPKWLAGKAEARLKLKMGEAYTSKPRAERRKLIAEEAEVVKGDIARMWSDFAQMSSKPAEEISQIRDSIIKKVEMRQRLVKMYNYKLAMEKDERRRESEAFWRQWLLEGLAGDNNEIEKYAVVVAEQTEAHVILRAVPVEIQNYLGKHRDAFPGMELKASTHRTYPFGHAACHVMGRVSRVNREDLIADNSDDETRQYLPNDQIGRGGLEALLEPALRGTKGKVVRVPGKDQELSRLDPVAGKEVHVTLDIELQSRIESIFPAAKVYDAEGNSANLLLHGSAVVIDVPTGEVLALASYPTYDLNAFDALYEKLYADEINSPLLHRATQSQLQPGSTIKPAVGLSAITSGVIGAHQGIECTGYLVIDGKQRRIGRCWVASRFENDPRVPSVAHHQIPPNAPHPTGYLTFGDALERSCNPYFETLADRLGMEGLSQWYERFGFGRPTGLGIAEARGRLPRAAEDEGGAVDRRYKTWFSGIGQDPVSATPIQMANMVATIARGGMWMRPRLISRAESDRLGIKLPALSAAPQALTPEGKPGKGEDWPEVYDLHLDKSALAAVNDGMQRVVYGPAGTGKGIVRYADALAGIRICGKTGTAQAPKFVLKVRDPVTGQILRDEKGRPKYEPLELGTVDRPNPIAPWYRGSGKDNRDVAHAWYVGYAPADRPQIAFAVMVEYGGSGGLAAAAVARETLIACAEAGYLKSNPTSPRAGVDRPAASELLRDVATGPTPAVGQ